MKEIYDLVKRNKACMWGLSQVKDAETIHDLIRILKSPKGIEFVMDQDFIPFEILDKYRNELESENIFFDGVHSLVNPRFLLILGGQINVEVNNYEVSQIYAKRGVLKLTSVEYAIVVVDCKDCQFIHDSSGHSKIKLFQR